MPNYRRLRVPGGTYLFTVNLLERKRDLLVRHIDDLREAVRRTKRDENQQTHRQDSDTII